MRKTTYEEMCDLTYDNILAYNIISKDKVDNKIERFGYSLFILNGIIKEETNYNNIIDYIEATSEK